MKTLKESLLDKDFDIDEASLAISSVKPFLDILKKMKPEITQKPDDVKYNFNRGSFIKRRDYYDICQAFKKAIEDIGTSNIKDQPSNSRYLYNGDSFFACAPIKNNQWVVLWGRKCRYSSYPDEGFQVRVYKAERGDDWVRNFEVSMWGDAIQDLFVLGIAKGMGLKI